MTFTATQWLTPSLRGLTRMAVFSAICVLGLTGNDTLASESPDQICPDVLKSTIRQHNLKPSRKTYNKAYRLCLNHKIREAKRKLLNSPRRTASVGDRRPRVVDHRPRGDRDQVRACMQRGKGLARSIRLPLTRANVGKINRYCLKGDLRGALAYVKAEGLQSCLRSMRKYVSRGGFDVDRRTWRTVKRHCRSGNDDRAIDAIVAAAN